MFSLILGLLCGGWQEQTPNVVQILAGNNGGSGAVVCTDPNTLDAYVLTCKHVVEQYRTATVTWPDGYKSSGNVVARGRVYDTALIHVRAPSPSFVPVAPKFAPAGTEVVALGYGGQHGPIRNLKLISWRSKIRGYKTHMDDLIQLDPYAESGDSGGPILDTQGRLVGIVQGGELAGPIGQAIDPHSQESESNSPP